MSWLSVSELEYFLSVENIEISLYAQAWQSLLLLTQGNIYNRLRFLNKYLMFLEELNKLFRENWSKFLTAGYLVFWKQFPAAGYLDTAYIFTNTLTNAVFTRQMWPLYLKQRQRKTHSLQIRFLSSYFPDKIRIGPLTILRFSLILVPAGLPLCDHAKSVVG